MTAPVFVDTNVLVYSRDARDAAKHGRAREWVEFLWDTKRGRVSRQVLHESHCRSGTAVILGAAQSMGCGFLLSEGLPAGEEDDRAAKRRGQ